VAVVGEEASGLGLTEARRPRQSLTHFLDKSRMSLSALLVMLVLWLVFVAANPSVFLGSDIYTAVFTSLPLRIVLALPLVFVIVSGEIDLSFVSTMTLCIWAFAATVDSGRSPYLGAVFAVLVGAFVGSLNAVLVTRVGLSSLVATLGMSFLIRGLVLGGTLGIGISLNQLQDTPFYNAFVGSQVGLFPVQMLWALFFVVIASLLFYFHKFGAQVCCVGDNLESSREMGINVRRTKALAFIYVGIFAGIAGVFSALIYQSFWPRSGDPGELMLAVLASVFIGGTPTWGGVGTVIGAVFGAFSIKFIEVGVIEAGLTGFWTQLFNGLIILLALVGHKLHEPRHHY